MILFFDDEPLRMELWKEALEDAFGEVRMIVTASELLAFLKQDSPPPLELFVFDSMAPTPLGLTDQQTEYATRTGPSLFDLFRRRYPEVPAILLTNVRDDPLLRRFDKPTERVRSARKRAVGAKALVQMAKEMGVKPRPERT